MGMVFRGYNIYDSLYSKYRTSRCSEGVLRVFWGCTGDVLGMFWGGLGGVWKVSGRCLGGVWDVLEVFGRCLGVFGCCLVCVCVCVLGRFGSFRCCSGAGSRRIGARPVDMGCAVRFGTDRVSGSTRLRGKRRF